MDIKILLHEVPACLPACPPAACLFLCCWSASSVAELLIKRGGLQCVCTPAGPNTYTPLHQAAAIGHVGIAQALLKAGQPNDIDIIFTLPHARQLCMPVLHLLCGSTALNW